MKKQIAICTGLLMLGMGGAAPAGAQAFYPAPRVYPGPGYPDAAALSPFEITRILRASGFTPVSRPVRRGPYYVLLAVDRLGRSTRVMVDARAGDIVNVRPGVAGGPAAVTPAPPAADAPDLLAAPPRVPPRPIGEDAPVPPRAVPNPRAATAPAPTTASPPASPAPAPAPTRSVAASPPAPAPTHSGAAEAPELPPPPPLPRPRPKLTAEEEQPAETPTPAPHVPAARKPLFFGGNPTVKKDNDESAPIE